MIFDCPWRARIIIIISVMQTCSKYGNVSVVCHYILYLSKGFTIVSKRSAVMNGNGYYQRWSKDSKAAKYLKKAMVEGEIDTNNQPKVIYDSCPLFQKYKLDSFRAAFNKLKAELGCNVRNSLSSANVVSPGFGRASCGGSNFMSEDLGKTKF